MFFKFLILIFFASIGVSNYAYALSERVYLISVNDTIDVTTGNYIISNIKKANSEFAKLLIIELNTPGGQIEATRSVVQEILASKVPVAVNVTPAGAQAGSAGIMITMSANIAAMAPGTTIGAAPRVVDDLSSMVKGIARIRKRNVQWFAINSDEALKKKVIDYVVKDTRELLSRLDGKVISNKELVELRIIPPLKKEKEIVRSFVYPTIFAIVLLVLLSAGLFLFSRRKRKKKTATH